MGCAFSSVVWERRGLFLQFAFVLQIGCVIVWVGEMVGISPILYGVRVTPVLLLTGVVLHCEVLGGDFSESIALCLSARYHVVVMVTVGLE